MIGHDENRCLCRRFQFVERTSAADGRRLPERTGSSATVSGNAETSKAITKPSQYYHKICRDEPVLKP